MSEKRNKRDFLPKKRNENSFMLDAMGKMPPQAVDIEIAVLGAVMIDAKNIDKVMSEFIPDIFYLDEHQLIAEAICELARNNKPIDILTVGAQLKTNGTLEMAGGEYKLALITARVSSSANIEYHMKLVQQEALKRKLIRLTGIALSDAYNPQTDVFDCYNQLIVELETGYKSIIKNYVKNIWDIHNELLTDTMHVIEHGTKSGVISGLTNVDNVTNGWQKSDLIIIAGRPGMGKTAICTSMVYNSAVIDRTPTGLFSLEMSKEQVVGRLQSIASGINASDIIKKKLTMDDLREINAKTTNFHKAPLFIDDTPGLSIHEFKTKARKMVHEDKVEIIYVDYLQLMTHGMPHIKSREEGVSEISKALKGLAKELQIPIIALAQLSRELEKRGGDKKPQLSDLRESGQIEQDADLIGFVYRPEYYNIEEYEIENHHLGTDGLMVFIIQKHRNGALGEIPLEFVGHLIKVQDHELSLKNQRSQTVKPIKISEDTNVTITVSEPGAKSMYQLGVERLERENQNNLDETPF